MFYMLHSKGSTVKLFTYLGFCFMAVPLMIFCLWTYVSITGDSHPENVARFNSYFPAFLQGGYGIAFLSIISCMAAILFSSLTMNTPDRSWNFLNTVILALSALLLFLNLWQLM